MDKNAYLWILNGHLGRILLYLQLINRQWLSDDFHQYQDTYCFCRDCRIYFVICTKYQFKFFKCLSIWSDIVVALIPQYCRRFRFTFSTKVHTAVIWRNIPSFFVTLKLWCFLLSFLSSLIIIKIVDRRIIHIPTIVKN